MQSEFGANWRSKVAEYSSWQGLTETNEFNNWMNSNNIDNGYFNGIITAMKQLGNSNCN